MSNTKLTFEQIFQEEGLYKADSFTTGYAFKIRKNSFTNDMELSAVQYTTPSDILPQTEQVLVYGYLFTKEYRKIFTIKQLFE